MLVLQRNSGQSITIGKDIRITIIRNRSRGGVKVGIEAPRHIKVLREELEPYVAAETPPKTALSR